MREKISTVTIDGQTFEVHRSDERTCAEIYRRFRECPDYSIAHERCDDASCEICNRVFGGR